MLPWTSATKHKTQHQLTDSQSQKDGAVRDMVLLHSHKEASEGESQFPALDILEEVFHSSLHMTDFVQHRCLHKKLSLNMTTFTGYLPYWEGLWIWKPNLEKEACYLQ